jgi:2-dehydropantoate 2-reductase
MKIAIVGAGAMGTLLGHGFCKGGHEVTVLDLPARVSQLKETGVLGVVKNDGSVSSAQPARITERGSDALPQDLIILACKSQDLPAAAVNLPALADEDSAIVTIQNGIPWWYLNGLEGEPGRARIECLDAGHVLEKNIDAGRIVGCVAYPAAILDSEGRAVHVEGYRFPVGELDGNARDRTLRISRAFEEAGFKSRIIDDIRSEIWLKAWGALSINPISALTRATMEDICSFPETRVLVARMMGEAQEVAEALGARFRHTIEKRIEGARLVGAHKTSMLQDVEAGLPLELDALMLAVIELANLTGKPVPTIEHVYACTALLNRNLSLACQD